MPDYYSRRPTEDGYGRISTLSQLMDCAGHHVVLDVETTGLNPWPGRDQLIGVGYYCPDGGDGVERYGYIPTCTYQVEAPKTKKGKPLVRAVPNTEKINQTLATVDRLVSSEGTVLFGHNLKFDAHFLGIQLRYLTIPYYDTAIMIHLYDSRLPKAMAAAEHTFLGRNSKRTHSESAQDGIPKRSKKDFTLWRKDAIADYCVNDCMVTYQLALALKPKLIEFNLLPLFNKDLKYLAYLQEIERAGIKLDFLFCNRAVLALDKRVKALEIDLCDAVGRDVEQFNWRSYRQMSAAIWEGIGRPKPRNPFVKANGEPNYDHPLGKMYNEWCTAQGVLDHENHPLATLIADLRETYKLKGTVEGWFDLVDDNGFIHSSFNLTGTRTGRLSSSKPNLQNIATDKRKRISTDDDGGAYRSDEFKLRQAFVAQSGYKIISADHSQQEIRLLALLTQDETLLQALVDRKDMHAVVAEAIWGDMPDYADNASYYRGHAKNIHFAILYGLSMGAMAFRTGMTLAECQKILDDYWRRFPSIQPWQIGIEEQISKHGYTRYWSGRIWREDDGAKAYKGVNAQVQGGSADLMSIVVMRVADLLQEKGWGQVVSIIHDELLMEVKEECVEEAIPHILKTMEAEDLFGFPFAADCAVGDSYGSLDDDYDDTEYAVDIDELDGGDSDTDDNRSDSELNKEEAYV